MVETDYNAVMGFDELTVQSLWVDSPVVQMSNNHLACNLTAALSDVLIRCLYLNNPAVVGHSEGVITGNVFSSRSETGSVGYLNDAFIYISSTSGKGLIANNSFSSEVSDLVSGGTYEVSDNTTGVDRWLIHSNLNQKEILAATVGMGRFSTASTTANLRLSGFTTSTVASGITGSSTGDTAITCTYSDTGTSVTFAWIVPGSALPYGVEILSVALVYNLNDAMTTRNLTLSIISDDGGTDGTLSAIGGTGSATRTTTASGVHRNEPENNLRIVVKATLSDAGTTTTLAFTSLNITYKW